MERICIYKNLDKTLYKSTLLYTNIFKNQFKKTTVLQSDDHVHYIYNLNTQWQTSILYNVMAK